MSFEGPRRIRVTLRRKLGLLLASVVALALGVSGVASGGVTGAGNDDPAGARAETYQNPRFDGGDGTAFADPTVIKGRDGYWYAYATGDNYRIARSPDLVNWERVGSVWNEETRPDWTKGGYLWAPDIAYFDGRYYMTYTVAGSPLWPRPNRSVGVATAPTPTGPWTDSGGPLLEAEWWYPTPNAPRQFRSVMDTDLLITPDGRRILYYGGFKGGIYGVELSRDGLRATGERVKLTSEFSHEAVNVVHRDGWYYMLVSTGRCCRGAVSGYTVVAGRSRDPFGPFTDRAGVPLLGRTPGGTPVLAQNGNTWVGPGHHSIATDASGQDWMVYHAMDRDDPYRGDRPFVGNKRRLLIDRLDWIDGWPTVRGGAGPSDTRVPGPAQRTLVADTFEGRGGVPGDGWRDPGHWSIAEEPAGGFVRTGAHSGDRVLTADGGIAGDVRARAAVRLPESGDDGAVGLVLGERDGGGIRVSVDRAAGALVAEARREGAEPVRAAADLPANFRYESWHQLDVRIRGPKLVATVSDDGGNDPIATVTATLPSGLDGGGFGLLARDAAADLDDVTVAALYQPHTTTVPEPQVGAVDPGYSDEFDGSLEPAWQWVREPAATTRDGRLDFPVQPGDLTGDRNDVSVLLRDAPEGVWTVETKVHLSFGDDQPDRFPQAGIVVYTDDDHFLRFTHRAHGAVESTEYGKEMTEGDSVGYGSVDIVVPPGDVTWLRLHHRIDPVSGDHVYRAGASNDGEHWIWSTAYTLPAGAKPRLGLVAHGGDHAYTASFDYLRVLR